MARRAVFRQPAEKAAIVKAGEIGMMSGRPHTYTHTSLPALEITPPKVLMQI
jgi:hypothetical protein